MGEIDAARERYAQEFAYTAHLTSAAVMRAFARVPRERYLGPGPWRIFQPYGRFYWTTPDADPKHLYHDVLVAIDEMRLLNNGQPSFLASLIETARAPGGGPRPPRRLVAPATTRRSWPTSSDPAGASPRSRSTPTSPRAVVDDLVDLSRAGRAQRRQKGAVPGLSMRFLVDAQHDHPRSGSFARPHGRLRPSPRGRKTGWVPRRSRQRIYDHFISATTSSRASEREIRRSRLLDEAFRSGGWAAVHSLRRDVHPGETPAAGSTPIRSVYRRSNRA